MYALEKNDLVSLAGKENKHSSRSDVSRELRCVCWSNCFSQLIKVLFYTFWWAERSLYFALRCLGLLDINNEIILIRRIGLIADACTATGGDMRQRTAHWLRI